MKASKLALLRFLTLALAGAFLVIGLRRGEQQEVLQKAVRVCLECIGIG